MKKTLSIAAAVLGLALAIPLVSTDASAQYSSRGASSESNRYGHSVTHSVRHGRVVSAVTNYVGRNGRHCRTVTRSVYGPAGGRHVLRGHRVCN
jgi:hypothetical protein